MNTSNVRLLGTFTQLDSISQIGLYVMIFLRIDIWELLPKSQYSWLYFSPSSIPFFLTCSITLHPWSSPDISRCLSIVLQRQLFCVCIIVMNRCQFVEPATAYPITSMLTHGVSCVITYYTIVVLPYVILNYRKVRVIVDVSSHRIRVSSTRLRNLLSIAGFTRWLVL